MIAIGAKFNWPPRVTLDLTLWEIVAYVDGHNRAQEPEKQEAMSNDEFEGLLSMHNVAE